MSRAFSRVFHAFRLPNPTLGPENTATDLYARPGGGLNALETLILRVLGCSAVVYTSVTRINSAFPAISSVSNINSAIVSQYATDVEAEIDSIISNRYTLPLSVTCPLLAAIATRETIYRIAVQRALVQFPPAQQGKAPLQVQHEDDQKLLTKIAQGELGLVSTTGAVVAVSTTLIQITSTTKDYLPAFHEGAWGDMIQDPDKLDAILSDRDL